MSKKSKNKGNNRPSPAKVQPAVSAAKAVTDDQGKRIAERKEAAAKVEAARQAFNEARKAYHSELEGFCKKYGTYHYSTNGKDDIPSLFDLFDNIFRF